MNFALNLVSLRADLRELSARSRALKQRLRSTWQEPMAAEQKELRLLQRRITCLCALRAWSRGKLHFRNRPPGHSHCEGPEGCHARISERLAPSYALVLEQSA
jgi:hypothetical protein